MEKLIKSRKVSLADKEKNFKDIIKNEEVYSFLSENDIVLSEAIKYFVEFKMFQDNPEKYILKYEYGNVVLENRMKVINKGLYFLDVDYFKEDKSLEKVDYKDNKTKGLVVAEFLKNPNKGMYLVSNNGVGKTTLVTSLANIYYDNYNIRTLFVFWPDFIEKTKRFDYNHQNVEYINKVKNAKRLIIDDLGQESITQWARDDILHSIISFRLEKQLPTFITSNYLISDLENIYTFRKSESKKTKSIISKIQMLSKEFILSGEDLRKRSIDE